MANNKKNDALTAMEDDFAQWYTDVPCQSCTNGLSKQRKDLLSIDHIVMR